MASLRAHERAGSAAQLPGHAAFFGSPGVRTQEVAHVDRSASAQTHSAVGRPAILSKAEDAGTGQAVSEPNTGNLWMPAGAHTRSAVGTGALLFLMCWWLLGILRSLALYAIFGVVMAAILAFACAPWALFFAIILKA